MEANSSIALATLVLLLTGCFALPISETEVSNELICHTDFNSTTCSRETATTLRYYYNSINNTCLETSTCSLEYNSTYSTLDNCMDACNNNETESEETEPENACSIPTIGNGTAHIVNCNEIQCTVYYSCDHDNHFELYPEEKRGQRFQCNHGVWEDHTVTCAKVNINVLTNHTMTEGQNLKVTVQNGEQIILSCTVHGNATHNVTWSFRNPNSGNFEIVSNSSKYILTSVSESNEGKYSCSVTGIINEQIDMDLKVRNYPVILSILAVAEGDSIFGACYCKGNNVQASWIVDNEEINGTHIVKDKHQCYNVFTMTNSAHGEHTVQCVCKDIDDLETAKIIKTNVTTNRARRDVTEQSSDNEQLHNFCERTETTAIVIGHVLRQVRSTVHIKVQEILVPFSDDTVQLAEDSVILVHLNQQRLRRNDRYLMKLEKNNSRHLSVSSVPYLEGAKELFANNCR